MCPSRCSSVAFEMTVSVPTAVKFTLPLPALACDVSSPATTMKPALTATLSSPPAASVIGPERDRTAGQRGLKRR